jgi:methionine salvage enolase-phosphatase E1
MKETNKSNTVSVDRLDPNIGYTEENIIFVSNKVNQMKNAVTKELCIAIIKAYKERGL